MLPSGLMSVTNQEGRVRQIGKGLYVVEDAYKGDYDFFAPSRLYSTPQEEVNRCESGTSGDLSEEIGR
jgi:hypothetical protein